MDAGPRHPDPPRRAPPLALPLACAIGGILAADRWPETGAFVWCGILAAGVGWFGTRSSRASWLACLGAGFALAHSLAVQRAARFPEAGNLERGESIEAMGTGLVADAPVVHGSSARFPVRLRTLSVGGRDWRLGATVMVRWRTPAGGRLPKCGDLLEIQGMMSAPEAPRNPGQFDAAAWLRRQGIPVIWRAQSLRLVEAGAGLPVQALALRLREALATSITADLADQPAAASAIKAMVLGTREDMPEEINADFLHCGTLHIFSVSGLHVGLVAILIWRLLNLLRLTKRQAALASIPLIFFYALLTGWQTAAVRSALMAGVTLLGTCLNRRSSFFNVLCLAALAVLAVDTQQLFMAGAQLSFVVIAAIAVGGPWVFERFRPWCRPDPYLPEALWSRSQRWATSGRSWLAQSLAVSLAAAVGSAPLTLWHFQLVTPVSLVANLLHVPLAFGILATASASALAAPLWPWLSAVLNNANLVLARCCLLTAGWCADVPAGYLLWNPAEIPVRHACRLTVFDVADGGAVLIRTPEGRAWLLDAGRPEAFRSIVRPGLNSLGVKRLDGLILSHGDHDHVGGAAECLAVFDPAAVAHSPDGSRSPAFRAALALAGPRAREVAAGDTIVLDAQSSLRVLFPSRNVSAPLADDGCLILLLECAGRRILFSSDAGFLGESAVMNDHPDLTADLWIRGRHRSDLSGQPEFLNAIQPGAAICTSTDRPVSERLPAAWTAMAEAQGVSVFDQFQTGAVSVVIAPDGQLAVDPFLAASVSSGTARRGRAPRTYR